MYHNIGYIAASFSNGRDYQVHKVTITEMGVKIGRRRQLKVLRSHFADLLSNYIAYVKGAKHYVLERSSQLNFHFIEKHYSDNSKSTAPRRASRTSC